MRAKEFIFELAGEVQWNNDPQIGWWLDQDPVTFYHGTHIDNLENVLQNGLIGSEYAEGWVSLAVDPFTAAGYASMSGGEQSFRGAGAKSKHVPLEERVVFIIQIPQSDFLPKIAPQRGNVARERGRLSNREWYDEFNGRDVEYYLATEIRYPNRVPPQFIKGFMYRKKPKN